MNASIVDLALFTRCPKCSVSVGYPCVPSVDGEPNGLLHQARYQQIRRTWEMGYEMGVGAARRGQPVFFDDVVESLTGGRGYLP